MIPERFHTVRQRTIEGKRRHCVFDQHGEIVGVRASETGAETLAAKLDAVNTERWIDCMNCGQKFKSPSHGIRRCNECKRACRQIHDGYV